MERVIATSPADWTDCLACAGARALARKAAIWQRSNGESVALHAAGELLAVAYLLPLDDGRWEFCLAIEPHARARMRELCRYAHLTLRAFAQNQTVITYVTENNLNGVRMARLVGFRHAGGSLWTMCGEDHGQDSKRTFWGRRQEGRARSEEAAGGEPPAAACCE